MCGNSNSFSANFGIIIFCEIVVFLWSKKSSMASLKIISIVASFLCAISLCAKDFVVVIDAGHGGKDIGAVGNKAREKDINLGVALKLGKYISDEFNDVKVVYTRDNDTFVSLQGRAEIANKAHGDLFISIHTNSVDKRSKNRKTVKGAATYTLGLHRSEENLAVAKRENSVIELEDDYSATYQGFDPNSTESYIIFELNQNKHLQQSVDFASFVQRYFADAGRKDNGVRQAGFWVLAKTSMPAVLVELDFICNPTQESYLNSEKGQKELAGAIFEAFKDYKRANDYYSSSAGDKQLSAKRDKDKSKKKEKEKSAKADSSVEQKSGVRYRVQFLTSGKQLSERSSYFKGLDTDKIGRYYEKGLYKYTYDDTSDKNKAMKTLKKVQKSYPEAFIVEFENGKRIK